MAETTLGWVQNPADVTKLRKVVEIFDSTTGTHQELISSRLARLVTDAALKQRFIGLLSTRPIRLEYKDLKGSNRKDQPPNGIVNTTLPGEVREYTDDWSSDNFVRWAHTLGFLTFHPSDKSFSLSVLGQQYIDMPANDKGINEVYETALLSYPPVVRVLRLLVAEPYHLTKFEIGKQLGFVGESGFTSLPQELLVRDLQLEPDKAVRDKMLSDVEGTSDKYARMLASWLIKVGWVVRVPKVVTVVVAGQTYSYRIPQSYTITNAGQQALRRAARTSKNIYFEMLATNAPSRNYLRVRRALIIEALNGRGFQTLSQLETRLTGKGLTVTSAAISDDLTGLTNIGLQLDRNPIGAYRLVDTVQSLDIPRFTIEETQRGDVQEIKDNVRNQLTHLPHSRLSLIDLSYDNAQNRQFERETVSLLLECGFVVGPIVGGSNRPDGVAYTTGLPQDYGLIVDSKAYGGGFSCAADQRREMLGYVLENINRLTNFPWWLDYPATLTPPRDFRFLFVTSRFINNFRQQFQRLSTDTQSSLGAGITAANLLLYAEALKSGAATLSDGAARFGTLDEVTL